MNDGWLAQGSPLKKRHLNWEILLLGASGNIDSSIEALVSLVLLLSDVIPPLLLSSYQSHQPLIQHRIRNCRDPRSPGHSTPESSAVSCSHPFPNPHAERSPLPFPISHFPVLRDCHGGKRAARVQKERNEPRTSDRKAKRAEGQNPPKGALMMAVSSHCHLVICLVVPCVFSMSLRARLLVFPPTSSPARSSLSLVPQTPWLLRSSLTYYVVAAPSIELWRARVRCR